MRVSNNQIIANYLSDLRRSQLWMERLLRQTNTGLAFQRPREAPYRSAVSLEIRTALVKLTQYTRNVDDGRERLAFAEGALSDVNSQLQRVRELNVQGANTYLTRTDRGAIADEINQLLEQVISNANAVHRGRSVFAGYETLAAAFAVQRSTSDGMASSLRYLGDMGQIARNIGNNRDLDINFNGQAIYLDQTYTLDGRALSSTALGFSGTFELNDQLFTITPQDSLTSIRDLINERSAAAVRAEVTSDHRLRLVSLDSSAPIKVQDIAGTVLEDLGVLPLGAYNFATAPPTLPLTDSRGAIHTGAALALPLVIDDSNRDLVVTLSGAANNNYRQSLALRLEARTYASSTELSAEIQKKADLAFGAGKLVVNDLGGAISIETGLQSGSVLTTDLTVGGTADDGTVDTASLALALNAVASVAEVADTAGVDGNDRFFIDLGLSAYRAAPGEAALDLPPVEINLNALTGLSTDDIVADINRQLITNQRISGLVVARNIGGRIQLQTTKVGSEVLASDLLLVNAVAGPPVLATDTLGALGFYVNPLTGESAPPVPATIAGAQAFPVTVTAGVDDQFTIDLGAPSSVDGTNPGPQTVTLPAGAYATPAALAAALNAAIALNPNLKNAVLAQVNGANVDLVTAATGSRIQAADFVLADGLLTPGTLANLGLTALATPGGGSVGGQGDVTLPANMIDTMLRLRDELYGYASGSSLLVDLRSRDDSPLGLFPGSTIRVHAHGSFKDMTVQRFTTMDELARHIESQLGFGLKVDVNRDGSIRVFNPENTVVQGVLIEAFDMKGQHIDAFEKQLSALRGTLTWRSELTSTPVYDDSPFQRLTRRIGDTDRSLELIQSTLSQLGSRSKRLDLTLEQNDSVQVSLVELQTKNDGVDMAETLIKLTNAENILRAGLAAGARLIPPSLFDFLR